MLFGIHDAQETPRITILPLDSIVSFPDSIKQDGNPENEWWTYVRFWGNAENSWYTG